MITFPSVLDYVRFQLLATPMTPLVKERAEFRRQAIISSVASEIIALSTPAMLEDDRFSVVVSIACWSRYMSTPQASSV